MLKSSENKKVAANLLLNAACRAVDGSATKRGLLNAAATKMTVGYLMDEYEEIVKQDLRKKDQEGDSHE